MKSLKKYSIVAGAFALTLVFGTGSALAIPFVNGSGTSLSELMMAKGRGKVDDAPKPHGPLHRNIEKMEQKEGGSGDVFLAKRRGRIDDAPKPHGPLHRNIEKMEQKEGGSGDVFLAKRRGRIDDAPKPHGPLHRMIEDSSDGNMLAKNRKAAPAGAPRIDAPIKNAPHAPGAVHG